MVFARLAGTCPWTGAKRCGSRPADGIAGTSGCGFPLQGSIGAGRRPGERPARWRPSAVAFEARYGAVEASTTSGRRPRLRPRPRTTVDSETCPFDLAHAAVPHGLLLFVMRPARRPAAGIPVLLAVTVAGLRVPGCNSRDRAWLLRTQCCRRIRGHAFARAIEVWRGRGTILETAAFRGGRSAGIRGSRYPAGHE